jgi:hypothetical protein
MKPEILVEELYLRNLGLNTKWHNLKFYKADVIENPSRQLFRRDLALWG